MAALSNVLSHVYAITKLFCALLYLDVVIRFRSVTDFCRRKNDPTTAIQTQFLEFVEETVPTIRYSRRTSGAHLNECSVCLGRIGEGERVRGFKCNHLFHRDCIDGWLKLGRATCPVCRTRVLPDEVVADFQNRVGFDRRADPEMALLSSFLQGHRSHPFM